MLLVIYILHLLLHLLTGVFCDRIKRKDLKMNMQLVRFWGIAVTSAMCLLCANTAEAGFGKKMKKSLNKINTPSGYETPYQYQERRKAEIEAARKELEAQRLEREAQCLKEARLARQTAYEKARLDGWSRFQSAMSETVQHVLDEAKDVCPEAYAGLNAAVVAMQDGFRALPIEEDDAGVSAQKLVDWQNGIAQLIESAAQAKSAVEKRRVELAEAKEKRNAEYKGALSAAWGRFQSVMLEKIQPVLNMAKEDCQDVCSELSAAIGVVQDRFHALPTEEDELGSSAKKLTEWQKEVSKLVENAARTRLAVEKKQAEMAKAEEERMLANRAKLSALHNARRQNGGSEFTNRMAWATGNCLWDTEREVAAEVKRRTGLILKDCTPSEKSFPSQRIKCVGSPIGCIYEFGSLSATDQVFLVSAEYRMADGDARSVSEVLADIKRSYQFPADTSEKEESVITGYKLDALNLSPWAIYQYNYFTSRINGGDEKAHKGREAVICRYAIKPYAQTTTTFSCDGYDIVVKTDEKGERVTSVKTADMVICSELKKIGL